MTREELKKMVSENIEVIEDGVQAEVVLYGEKITDLTLSGDDVLGMPFQVNTSIIKNVSVFGLSFDDTSLSGDIIENIVIKNTVFSNLDVYDCGIYNVIFEGVTFDKYSTINKNLFTHCIFKNCAFDETDIMDNGFEGCAFEGCTFGYCDLEDSYFKESEIAETVFNQCKHLEFSDDFAFTVTTAK